jgi:DNA-binding transcriptional LysR family regulator
VDFRHQLLQSPAMKPDRSVPSFAMLRAFDAFGRAGGIRKAAAMLGVDHAVVSRHLASLEAFVGTALVDRANGRRALTNDGAEYHRRIAAAFDEIAVATQLLRKREDHQLLIWCSPGFAFHWLSPRLAQFLDEDSPIAVELRPMDYGPDFAINEADGDIRYVRGGDAAPPPGCRWIELASPQVYPVASRGFADAVQSRLHAARDMLAMRLLHEESDAEWRMWFEGQGLALSPASIPGPRLWHAHVMLDAARSGQGIALANDFLARNDLRSGQLVRVEPDSEPFAPAILGGYRFTARADRWNNSVVARFRNWLAQSTAAPNAG